MKKHFLLLLMAFFSLAGWAQTDLSTGDWKIVLSNATATYTGSSVTPTVSLENTSTSATLSSENFTVTWSPSAPKDVLTSGYTVTVTSNMTNTYGELPEAKRTAKFYVLKASNATTNTPKLATGRDYNGEPLTLVATVPTVNFGTVQYSTDNGTTWSTTVPAETNPGVYKVWYKVDATDNYAGIAKTQILGASSEESVEIAGLTINSGEYTAPTAKTGLKFQYASNAAVPQDLITAGSVPAAKGLMEYRAKSPASSSTFTAWSSTIPQGTVAGDWTVEWRISGQNGYADVTGSAALTVNIAKETPVITKPTVATSLVYNGLDQALLSAAATATFGASVTYAVNYKANAEATTWTSVSTGLTELSAVTGKNAGIYQIVTSAAEQANTVAATSVNTEVTIGLADAFTAAPTAKDLTWNNAEQVLITAGTGTVDNVVEYQLIGTNGTTVVQDWTTSLSAIKANRAGTYTVKYRVATANYKPITATAIPVTIKKKVLSVKVNNATKTYDASTSLSSATVDGGLAKFTFLGEISGANDFSALTDWATTTEKNAGTHTGVLTVLTATLETINTDKGYDYDYAVIPGNLTINQKEIWVQAHTGLTTAYGVARNISAEYDVIGLAAPDEVVDRTVGATTIYGAFSVAPVLTSNAGENPAIGTYALSFTEGTLKTNGNYKLDLTKGTNGYVIPASANFKVEANADSKVVITVLPQTQAYTGAAESWDELVEGTHYAVSGLIGDDQIDVSGLTFTREDATNFNVRTYALEATGAAIPTAIAAKYPGGIVYNPSTFTITPKELTATVAQQTVKVGDTALPDADAWTVTGLVAADEATGKSVLGGEISIVTPTTTTASPGLKNDAILLTITNTNYSLKSGTQYGKLNVIATTGTLFLDDSKADNLEKIAEKDGDLVNVQIQFNRDATLGGARTWAAGEWNTMVLPFDISVADLSQKLGYAIFNVIDPSRTVVDGTGSKFYGKLTMTGGNGKDNVLAANKPFLVKTAQAIPNEKIIDFGAQTIVAPTVGGTVVDAGGDCKFVGTYEKKTVTKDDNAAIWFMLGNYAGWAYINTTSSASWDIVPFAGYIDMSGVPAGARSITFYAEELDGSVTAIKSISTDNSSKLSGEGWYNLNGVKLDGAPSKKGIYIQNGKKVVVK